MSHSMSFSTADLAAVVAAAGAKVSSKSTNGRNAQYYKERLESHVSALAGSTDRVVRLAVVSSVHASASCLKSMLAAEADAEIIGVILTHPNLSKTVKTDYCRKNTDLVKSIIEAADVEDGETTETIEDDGFNEDDVNEALQQ